LAEAGTEASMLIASTPDASNATPRIFASMGTTRRAKL
jgi:hypothetical protein